MSYLAQYKRSDFKRVSWNEYGRTLDSLHQKVAAYVKKNGIKIDAVVPILRGGAFPGAYLTFKLGLLRILPVQYKYFFTKDKIVLKQLLAIPKNARVGSSPVFLLVENNHCFGLTASTAAKDLKRAFPKCRILYAVDHIDYSYQSMKGVEAVFSGKLTNETRKLSPAEAKRKRISPLSYAFPWESVDEEWVTVKGKQFEYSDTSSASRSGQTKKVIPKG